MKLLLGPIRARIASRLLGGVRETWFQCGLIRRDLETLLGSEGLSRQAPSGLSIERRMERILEQRFNDSLIIASRLGLDAGTFTRQLTSAITAAEEHARAIPSRARWLQELKTRH